MQRQRFSTLLALAAIGAFAWAATPSAAAGPAALRPPAVPLVTHDPYFSIWAARDKLTDGT